MLRKELYMKYPFFASFLVLCAIFYHNRKKADKIYAQTMKDYFDRENEANNTRKQPLDNLDYISVPSELLSLDVLKDDSTIEECIKSINQLSEESIVNFTGLSNTDLKLQYGPANLPFLQKCDMNYTYLVRTLNTWASRLYEMDYHNEALIILEYAISIKADISNIYYTAADIYLEQNTPDKINDLLATAESLNSVMKNSIIRTLKTKTQ